MAESAEAEEGLAGVERGGEIANEVEGENGREFFGGERVLSADAGEFDADDRGVGRDFEAGHARDFLRRLADAVGIDAKGAGNEELGESGGLLLVGDVGVVAAQEIGDAGAQRAFGDDSLFAGAERAVVEGFAGDDFGDGVVDIGGGVDEHRDVSGADAVSGLAARVCGLDHGGAAGGEDHGSARVLHQGGGAVHGGGLHALDEAFGSARGGSGAGEDIDGGNRSSGRRAGGD